MTGRVSSRGGTGVLLGVAALVVMPLVLAPRSGSTDGVTTLSIITPHNEQIRYEFARAFRAWHQRVYHEAAGVQWLVPGGTAVIQHMLEAQYTASLDAGDGITEMIYNVVDPARQFGFHPVQVASRPPLDLPD